MDEKIFYIDGEYAVKLENMINNVNRLEFELQHIQTSGKDEASKSLSIVQYKIDHEKLMINEVTEKLERGLKWFRPSRLEDREFLHTLLTSMKAGSDEPYNFEFSCGGLLDRNNKVLRQRKATLLNILNPLLYKSFTGKISIKKWNDIEQVQCWSEPKIYIKS